MTKFFSSFCGLSSCFLNGDFWNTSIFIFWICSQLFTVDSFFLFVHLMTRLTLPQPKVTVFFPPFLLLLTFSIDLYLWSTFSICVLNESSSILAASCSHRVNTNGAGWLGSPRAEPHRSPLPSPEIQQVSHINASQMVLCLWLWKWLFVKNFQVYSCF